MLYTERAVAVVLDDSLDGVGLAVVGDAVAGVARDLAQRVGVLAGSGVLDGAHRDRAVGGVGAGGDDLVALDELEGELALSHVAAGQELGRGDLVGDARLNRRHVIGVGERKCHIAVRLAGHPQITLAVISHGEGNRTRRLDVVGHASDLAGLCHGVGKGVLALLGLLAQSLVEVVERKGNLAKVDLALGIIGHARVRGHGCALFTGHGKGELAGNVSRGQAIRNLQILLARKRCLDRCGSVGVHKLVAGVAVDSRRRQGTIAVVGNGHICVNCRRGSAHARRQLAGLLGSNVMNSPRGLICAGVKRRLVFLDKLDKRLGRVRQRTELNLATLVGCVQQDLVVPRVAQRKLEFTVDHQAPRERLGSLKSQRGFRLGAIGVRELSLTRGLFNVGLKLALGVNRHSHLERGNVLAVGNATGVALDLADLIGVLARLGISNLAKVNGCLALVEIGIGHSYGRGVGHRGIVVGRRGELKLKRIRIRPLAALEHLGQTKVSLGIHRCRLGCKAKDNLAVVAQVRMHVRGSRNGGKVVPPGVKHVARGLGHIAAHVGLGGMQLVDIGKSRGSLVKGPVAVLFDQSAVVVGDLVPFKHHNGIVVLRLKVFAHRHKLVLVIIDAATLRLYRRALGACLVRVDRRDLLEVIVAVGIGGLKLGNNIAQLAARPLVGQEVDRLVVGTLVGVDILLEFLIGRKQAVARVVLDARGVFNLNRLDVIERRVLKNPLFHVHVIVDQRNQRCGNLDRHDIALLRVVRTRDGDDQVLGNTQKLICVHIALGGLGHLVNGFAINLSADKLIDLHEVAQLITKGDVAGLAGVVAILDLGWIALVLGDRGRDILKYLVELIGVRRSLVEVGILGALTKLIGFVGRGVWIVARHGVHEPVFFACLANGLIRVRTAKDADGVDGGAFIFHGLGGINGIISDTGLKTIRTCRRAVGKEHDDLLGIRAARHVASKLKAVISLRSAGRFDEADRILKFRRSAIDTRRQALHNLRIVVRVSLTIAIRIVADCIISLIARELNDGNLMPFVLIIDALVLLGNGIDKTVRGGLECIDARSGPFAHIVTHRTGGIEHENDIERFSDQRRCIRGRRDRGKRRHKVRLFVLCGLDRLVRPDPAHITCRLVLLAARRPVLPTAGGVRIDCLCRCRSVHSGAGPGVSLGQHGKCCGRQYQHNGQYHRQEAPRVLTHRVSLLAGSNLASA